MSAKPRIVLIIEDDVMFYPRFVARLIDRLEYEVVGIVIAKAAAKHNRTYHLLKKIRYFTFRELVKLFWRRAALQLRILLRAPDATLAGIARKRGIPCLHVAGKANTPEVIAWLAARAPDVILSASPLILGEQILAIPKVAINMHFSLLPAYKGIMPIFHAMADGEKTSGISLHAMTKEIDAGKILYQREVALDYSRTLFENYLRFFDLAVECVAECLKNMETGANIPGDRPTSYFGHPDHAAWQRFRSRNVAFI
jgi:folate-dependent phosphoribosylglycinamide formyltransferase PurN